MFVPMKATTSRPARRKSCSTAGAIRTRTRRSTASPGAPTAGSTAATASSRTRGRQAGHAGQGPHADQRRRLALSSDPERVRGLRPRHEQSVGPRLQRLRPGVRHRLRHPARLPHHPGRPLSRQAGSHFNPYTYDDIKTIADHLHWQGANPWAGNSSSDSLAAAMPTAA